MTIAERAGSGTHGIYLLFATGKRPDLLAVKAFIENQAAITLSHDPTQEAVVEAALIGAGAEAQEAQTALDAAHPEWAELLRDGLAFDLVGLAPGKGVALPQVHHRFDFKDQPNALQYEALRLAPGHHLVGGERTLPVAKGLIALGRDIMRGLPDVEAVIWPHSKSVIGQRFFESTISAWLDGGPFPALGLTAFGEADDGGLQSVGLEFWIGQELLIEPPLSTDKVAATRMGVRLVNQLVLVGGIDSAERVMAPDGTRLMMRPSRNGRYIRVARE